MHGQHVHWCAAASAALLLLSGCRPSLAPSPPGIALAAPPRNARTAERITRSEGVPNSVRGGFGLTVPRGFHVNIFAAGLTNPRRLCIAPGATARRYDVLVTESKANRIRLLRESNGDGHADSKFVFTTSTDQPYGLAFHPSGWLYVGNTDSIVRFPYHGGATRASGGPQFIAKLTRGGYNQHWTRNLLFSHDARRLFVTVGSSCNTCEERDNQRAAISVMNPDGSGRRVYASGLRNPVGLAWRPGTTELWAVVNERDYLGDNQPPDAFTLARDGAFYGWPYAYTDIRGHVQPDPDFGRRNRLMVARTTPATVPVQAHSAALGLTFYQPPRGSPHTAFPHDYDGDAFLAYHGSWNRSHKTGYKIVRVHFQQGHPVSITDFVTGFLHDRSAWGRPVDVCTAPDGSLLFSDDTGGKIWRVSYVE